VFKLRGLYEFIVVNVSVITLSKDAVYRLEVPAVALTLLPHLVSHKLFPTSSWPPSCSVTIDQRKDASFISDKWSVFVTAATARPPAPLRIELYICLVAPPADDNVTHTDLHDIRADRCYDLSVVCITVSGPVAWNAAVSDNRRPRRCYRRIWQCVFGIINVTPDDDDDDAGKLLLLLLLHRLRSRYSAVQCVSLISSAMRSFSHGPWFSQRVDVTVCTCRRRIT